MLIHEAARAAGLTKKAIEYYVEQGLLSPGVLDNGYRIFCEGDVRLLRRISVLRRLSLGVEDIRSVLADSGGQALRALCVQKELGLRREQLKMAAFERLSLGDDYEEIDGILSAIEQGEAVSRRLLSAFPGYYGRFICLHFSRFLGHPIATVEQKSAYLEIIAFLDGCPPLHLSEELQSFLAECTRQLSCENISGMLSQMKQSVERPERFLAENREMMEWYLAYKQSEEYKSSPAAALRRALKSFHTTSGYYDVFIPAMKRLSPEYAEYYNNLEMANERLLKEYPEAAGLE